MKTSELNQASLPTTGKMILYVTIVSALCFLSCLVTKAQSGPEFLAWHEVRSSNGSDKVVVIVQHHGFLADYNLSNRLELALVEEIEEEQEIESWMLDAGYFEITESNESEIELEPWMLDASYFEITESYEEELEIEPWMLDANYFMINETIEEEIELEAWMTDFRFETVKYNFLVEEQDDELMIEPWMLNVDYSLSAGSYEKQIELESWMLDFIK